MTTGSYIKLYQAGGSADTAFLLAEGNVFIFVTEVDKYVIRGKNLIVGASELILNEIGGMETNRVETAVADASSTVRKISREKLAQSLDSHSFMMNLSMVLAKQVLLTNSIINKNLAALDGDDRRSREISSEYYRIVARLRAEFDKRRLPWLRDIVKKFEASLTYKRGETFERTSEPTKIVTGKELESRMVEFPKGALICDEGSEGSEMYILQSGSIDVLISGNRVTSIADGGTVIGEMALLLGEKRTATLRAGNNVVLTVIRKSELPEVSRSQPDLFRQIASSLARKHYFNVEKIHAVNKMLIEMEIHGDEEKREKKKRELQHAFSELSSLKKEVRSAVNSKPAEFLDDLVESLG